MNELNNPQLAIQVAMGVTMVVGQMMQKSYRVEQKNSLEMILSAMMRNAQQTEEEIDSEENTQ